MCTSYIYICVCVYLPQDMDYYRTRSVNFFKLKVRHDVLKLVDTLIQKGKSIKMLTADHILYEVSVYKLIEPLLSFTCRRTLYNPMKRDHHRLQATQKGRSLENCESALFHMKCLYASVVITSCLWALYTNI